MDRAKLDGSVRTELDDIPDSLTDLSDTPSALGTSDQILKMNTAGDALEFADDEAGMEEFTSVSTDLTLDGDGTTISPLSLADDAVSTGKVQDAAITQDKLSPDVVTLLTQSEEGGLMAVASDSSLSGVGTSDSPLGIADDGVTTLKILDLNVTTEKLADDAVSTIKVIDQAITEAKLHPDVVAQLGDNENLLSSVASDGSIDGDGTDASPLSLADDAVTTNLRF